MPDQYLGEIRPFSFGKAPSGWVPCQGQLLSIPQNQALFSLLGTTYGGDGRTTFGLPDLRGRVPASVSQSMQLGQKIGGEQVGLTSEQVPGHSHPLNGTPNTAKVNPPSGNFLAQTTGNPYVRSPQSGTVVSLLPATIAAQGGGQMHENRQPYLALNFCIALSGTYPTRP